MTPSSQLLQSFDVPGPRYTSNPSADRFVVAFAVGQYLQALELRRHSARSHAFPLSVYVHIPFCESLCYYCACNKIITGKYERAEQYLKSLQTEVELLLPHLGTGNVVSQLHFGGGTPTYLRDPELRSLMQTLGKAFQWKTDGEYSVEVPLPENTRHAVGPNGPKASATALRSFILMPRAIRKASRAAATTPFAAWPHMSLTSVSMTMVSTISRPMEISAD